jgi:hypothetical protein
MQMWAQVIPQAIGHGSASQLMTLLRLDGAPVMMI